MKLPSFDEIDAIHESDRTAIQRFLYENSCASKKLDDAFREQFSAALDEAVAHGGSPIKSEMDKIEEEIGAKFGYSSVHVIAFDHLRQHIKTLDERLRCPGHIDGHYCQHCEATIESPL
jgi:hypothetical protein